MNIRETLKPIDELWNRLLVADVSHHVQPDQPPISGVDSMDLEESVQFALTSWHGYGWRTESTGLVVSPFIDSPKDRVTVTTEIKRLLPSDVRVDSLVMPHFQYIGSGKPTEFNNPFQPGNVILRDCSSAHKGTIGAFLAADDGTTWLLSNRHVLDQCASSRLLGAGRTELGTDVRLVPFQNTGNLVDAGVVKIKDPSKINPQFEEVGPVKQFDPQIFANLEDGTPVSKFGNFTKLTSGKLVLHCPKVKVEDFAGIAREFVDQFAIVSEQGNSAFAQGGDSGSLVLSEQPDGRSAQGSNSGSLGTSDDKQPMGLLFAMSDQIVLDIPEEQSLKPPFYLANRWDNVIKQLSEPEIANSPLKLELGKQQVSAAKSVF